MSMKFLGFALVYSVTAVAAETQESLHKYFEMSPLELSTIPVSIASGTPKTVSQSAAITSVVSAEQIKAMGATELHEVLETIPGMHAGLQTQTSDYKYAVRGMNNSTNSELLIMLDGTRITSPYLGSLMTGIELSLENVQRIEVIRGPGSALYGADAFAGVVNIVTKKAEDIRGTSVGGRMGNWNTQSGWGHHSTQAAGWNIGSSFQYQHSTGDPGRIIQADLQTAIDQRFQTHASNAPGQMNTGYESFNGHLSLQRKHWDLSFWGFSANSGTRAGVANALDPKGKGNTDQYVADARFSTEDWLNDWELTAHLSYLRADFNAQFQTFPNNAILPMAADGNIDFNRPVGLVYFPNGANANLGRSINVPGLELGAIFKGIQQHSLRMQASYRYEQISTSVQTNIGTGTHTDDALRPLPQLNTVDGSLIDLSNTPYTYLPETRRSIFSAVLQDEWQLADAWQLTTGVRYDHYSDFGSTVNPRVALVWDVNTQLTSKWLYGRAFRAPSFSELGALNNPSRIGNMNLQPEIVDTVEWALDFHPIKTLRLASNFFYYRVDDFIDLLPNANKTTSTFNNTYGLEGYGSEFEWNWQISEQWHLQGNYAWQHSTNAATHQRSAGAPEHHVYVAGIWHFLPQWQLQSQLNWVGNLATDLNDHRPLDDYETIDFIIKSKKLLEHYSFSAALKNAFDTRYCSLASTQLPQNIPMPGRSFYVEMSYSF